LKNTKLHKLCLVSSCSPVINTNSSIIANPNKLPGDYRLQSQIQKVQHNILFLAKLIISVLGNSMVRTEPPAG